MGNLVDDERFDDFFQRFPVLETERLVLRELREDDAAEAHRSFSHPEMLRYLGKSPPASIEETREGFVRRNMVLFHAREGVRWVLTLRGEDRFLGSCGHWRLMKSHQRSEIGYDLHPEHWGKGLMTEALRAILRCGFEQMGLHAVEAHIDPANINSRRVLQRLGFTQDGLLRENFYFAGAFTDTAVFSLLRREFAGLGP